MELNDDVVEKFESILESLHEIRREMKRIPRPLELTFNLIESDDTAMIVQSKVGQNCLSYEIDISTKYSGDAFGFPLNVHIVTLDSDTRREVIDFLNKIIMSVTLSQMKYLGIDTLVVFDHRTYVTINHEIPDMLKKIYSSLEVK